MPTDPEPRDPVAPLAPVPAPGSYLSLTWTVDKKLWVEWDVHHPPRPVYRNGLATNNDPEMTILDKGPHPDPGFPIINPPRGHSPTGNSDIDFGGFWLGGNGTELKKTPPRGEVGDGDKNGGGDDDGDDDDNDGGQPASAPIPATTPAPMQAPAAASASSPARARPSRTKK